MHFEELIVPVQLVKINGVIVFKRFKSKTRAVLGMDISPTSIKILELSFHEGKPCIKAYGCMPIPPNTIEAGHIINCDVLTSTIKTLLSEMNPTTRGVALAIPDSLVIRKKIQLVKNLTDLELEHLAFHEAKKQLRFSSDEINVDYAVLGDSDVLGMMDVLLVISKCEPIFKRVKAVKNAGLEALIIDIESYAIERAVDQINTSHEKVIAVANFLNNEEIAPSFLVAFGLALRQPHAN